MRDKIIRKLNKEPTKIENYIGSTSRFTHKALNFGSESRLLVTSPRRFFAFSNHQYLKYML